MRMQARAKINWTLDIVGRREDTGYHLLDSLMQPLELHDILDILPSDKLTLTIDNMGAAPLSAGEDNLVMKAARALLKAAGEEKGAEMVLTKLIPMGAGLGGGSADAAAALRGLNEFWHFHFDLERLCQIGLPLGADIPFCLHDAPRRVRGIGEFLTPIPVGKNIPLVLIQPCEALSTKEVFAGYHALPPSPPSDHAGAQDALARGDLHFLNACARNALEPVSLSLRPEMKAALEALTASGAVMARMTGSGSVVFGAYETKEQAESAFKQLQKRYASCPVIRTSTAL